MFFEMHIKALVGLRQEANTNNSFCCPKQASSTDLYLLFGFSGFLKVAIYRSILRSV